MAAQPPLIAIVNHTDDVRDVLRQIFELEGFAAVSGNFQDQPDGQDAITFLLRRDPQVVIYDIAPPYVEIWQRLRRLQAHYSASQRAFVVTTSNTRVLTEQVSESNVCDVIGTPFDLDDMLAAVRACLPAAV